MRRPLKQAEPRNGEGPDAARVLTLLGALNSGTLTTSALRQHGVRAPAHAIYELQLAGYDIDRVARENGSGPEPIGYRLRTPASVAERTAARDE